MKLFKENFTLIFVILSHGRETNDLPYKHLHFEPETIVYKYFSSGKKFKKGKELFIVYRT